MKIENRILVVDDEPSITDGLRLLLGAEGHAVETSPSFGAARTLIERRAPNQPFDLVLTDLQLPDDHQGGLSLLRLVKELTPETEVIVITGHATVSEAVEATKAGAYNFVEKPFEPEQILLQVERALERRRLLSESQSMRKHFQRQEFSSIIGGSKAMQMIYETISSVAKSDANVLIIGESGTGKELIANAIHFNSLRAANELVKVNCSALPKELIEAELFGYVKGAFTGAIQNRSGLVAQAKGGSLMLDEVGEMPIELQPKLLRVLEERRFRPVGATETFEADFRLICATNREPREAIKEGLMREDLFYRVSTITINVPPLRERAEDLQLLTDFFFHKFKDKYNRPLQGFSQSAYHRVFAHRWPGNVRELQNAIERAVLLAKGSRVEPEDLPFGDQATESIPEAFYVPPNMTLDEIERIVIEQTLKRTSGNKQAAAQVLGIYRPRLYSKIRKYRIQVPRESRKRERRADESNNHHG
ncbi:MAG TPA: sigma-54 dependent transcriptional regulator [Blastocatellia bacterium]|nr:sigma-54 dependent transcriptional regulator [Blastocatellia bacterium]HNG30547.1 sigma-54 dependent transcriptional regulator [Blastocatellia bacterium]